MILTKQLNFVIHLGTVDENNEADGSLLQSKDNLEIDNLDVFVHNAQLFADNEDGNNYFTDGKNYKHGCNYNNKFTKRQMIQIILMQEKNKKKMTFKKKKSAHLWQIDEEVMNLLCKKE